MQPRTSDKEYYTYALRFTLARRRPRRTRGSTVSHSLRPRQFSDPLAAMLEDTMDAEGRFWLEVGERTRSDHGLHRGARGHDPNHQRAAATSHERKRYEEGD